MRVVDVCKVLKVKPWKVHVGEVLLFFIFCFLITCEHVNH